MANGHNEMDTQAIGAAVVGGISTAAGQWLWRKFTRPRPQPLTLKELNYLVDQVESNMRPRMDAHDRGIHEVLRVVEEIREEQSGIKGRLDAHGRVLKRLSAEAEFGD